MSKYLHQYGSLWMGASLMLLAACTTTPPARPDDICHIFNEKPHWYKAARKAEKRWGAPIPVLMAFTHKESSYVAKAKPPRGKMLWVIPWRRPSSAYGYAQATDAAWKDYQKATHSPFADRDDFADAMDFIGWYNQGSQRRLGLKMNDAFGLYLAYHEGRSGYASGKWKGKKQLLSRARRVERRAANYRNQYQGCAASLARNRHWWWPFG